jgi:ribonuclease BN (tRNA processing enzyme)
LQIRARPNPHGATTALAFRIEEEGRAFVYASDVGYPPSGPSPEIIDLYRNAQVLLHDCTYTPQDQATRRNRGFSSYADAAAAAVAAQVKHLVMFHYDQDYSDELIDELLQACRAELDRLGGSAIELSAAVEGSILVV